MTTVTVETPVHVEAPAVPVFPELVRAAEIIRERGWYQGDYYEGFTDLAPYRGGEVCALGALGVAHSGNPEKFSGRLAGRLSAALGFPGALSRWNDRPERTQEEVIELLERVGWLGA